MEYMDGMEQLDHTLMNKVLKMTEEYDYSRYTAVVGKTVAQKLVEKGAAEKYELVFYIVWLIAKLFIKFGFKAALHEFCNCLFE